MTVDRRDFLRTATGVTVGAGLALGGTGPLAGAQPSPRATPVRRRSGQAPDFVVIGAGNFGMWTALNLIRLGATVTVVDPFGAGNSRSTSGGETRGVRSSYGDRPHGLLWTRWATESIQRWREWDEQNQDLLLPPVFFETGDLIMRPEMEPYLEDTALQWDQLGVAYESFGPDEVTYRWPWINPDGITTALYEPQAGVVRARRAIESVAMRFLAEGGEMVIGRASMGSRNGGRLENITLEPEGSLSGATFIYAVGPWFPKVFPELMGNRLSISMGHVFYFAVPPGNTDFMYPNMPSYGIPGGTGWPGLPQDLRGFRVRTGGRSADDPDTSDRWIPEEYHERPREVLAKYFPALADAVISETRACHYEGSVSRNFIIDKHPDFENVWLAGGGSAESFKQGPVLGEYIAKRVMDLDENPELAEGFELSEEEFEPRDESRRRGPG